MAARDTALTQLSNLLAEVESRLGVADGEQFLRGQDAERSAVHTRLHAAIERWSAPGDSYRRDAAVVEATAAVAGWKALELLGIVRALRDDYAAGYMHTLEELVHADLFSDFLEMAKELLDKGFKDASAVLAGSVLEEHLRKLALKSNISVVDANARARKADSLNADLARERIYNMLEQKSVTAWLDLRNKAAHGEYGEYDAKQVSHLIEFVGAFLERHLA